MVGGVAHAAQLRQLLKQGFFHPALQGLVHHAAALATTAELENGIGVRRQLDKADLPAVRRQRRVYFVVENVIDTIFQRAVFIHARQLRVRRLDGQLSAHAVLGVIDQGIFQKRQAAGIEPGSDGPEVALFIALKNVAVTAVGDTGLCLRGSRLVDKYPHTQGIFLL